MRFLAALWKTCQEVRRHTKVTRDENKELPGQNTRQEMAGNPFELGILNL
jgi:hypothetical protein